MDEMRCSCPLYTPSDTNSRCICGDSFDDHINQNANYRMEIDSGNINQKNAFTTPMDIASLIPQAFGILPAKRT